MDDGVTKKVLFELDIDGDADICTHELKLSEEIWSDPEHVVLEVLVVTVVVSIASEKVTDVVVVRPAVAESAGEDEETEGAVVSVSTMKRVAVKVFPVFPELSVTFIVQL